MQAIVEHTQNHHSVGQKR